MADARKAAFLTAWDALRAAHHVLWTLHWQAEGTPSYGDHLLYERLYKARVEEIDRVAELIAALFGASALDAVASWDRATPFIGLGAKRPAPERATLIVEAAMEAVEAAIEANTGKHAAAADNVFAGVADALDNAYYLLAQRTRA
jgi:hypothetical protein